MAHDASGLARHAVVANASWLGSSSGPGLRLSASLRSCVIVPHRAIARAETRVVWMRTWSAAPGTVYGSSGAAGSLYEVRMVLGKVQVYVFTGTAGAAVWEPVSSPAVNDGAWHMVAATRNGSQIGVYVDGSIVALSTVGIGAGALGQYVGSLGTCSVGCRVGVMSGQWSSFFDGDVVDVQQYEAALTGPQVMQLYAASRLRSMSTATTPTNSTQTPSPAPVPQPTAANTALHSFPIV